MEEQLNKDEKTVNPFVILASNYNMAVADPRPLPKETIQVCNKHDQREWSCVEDCGIVYHVKRSPEFDSTKILPTFEAAVIDKEGKEVDTSKLLLQYFDGPRVDTNYDEMPWPSAAAGPAVNITITKEHHTK